QPPGVLRWPRMRLKSAPVIADARPNFPLLWQVPQVSGKIVSALRVSSALYAGADTPNSRATPTAVRILLPWLMLLLFIYASNAFFQFVIFVAANGYVFLLSPLIKQAQPCLSQK